ncbi:MAG TPA: FAD-dependent oxidoreductase, partial [Actinopolymorphaceae bacterium]
EIHLDEDRNDLRDEGTILRAQRVLLATGVADVLPPVEGLAECWGTSVIHCTHCAAWEHRGHAWAVVADHPGYAAVAASIVAPWTSDVVVCASDDIAALRHEAGRLRAVELTDGSLVERDTVLWHLPQRPVPLITHLAERRSLALDAHGFVVVDDRYRTNLPGIFAAGDAASKAQTAIAAMSAAATAAHWLVQ